MLRLFICHLFLSFLPEANLKFVNKNSNSAFPMLEIAGERTIIYQKTSKSIKRMFCFNQVPENVNNADMRSTYKMTVVKTNPSGKLTLEITYILDRLTNKYSAYLKTISVFIDDRPNITTEDYFEVKT